MDNTNYAVTQTLKVKEYTLYGSSRLGVHEANATVSIRSFNAKYLSVSTLSPQLLTPAGTVPAPTYTAWETVTATCTTTVGSTTTTASITFKRYALARGQKKYELANHLGNVLAVITDRKIQDVAVAGTFLPCVASYSDYYPFGWEMPGRSSTVGATRYGFNGKENDGETGFQDYGMRQYDRRGCRFISADPLIVNNQEYPGLSSYQFASNTPIQAIDLDGLEGLIKNQDVPINLIIQIDMEFEKNVEYQKFGSFVYIAASSITAIEQELIAKYPDGLVIAKMLGYIHGHDGVIGLAPYTGISAERFTANNTALSKSFNNIWALLDANAEMVLSSCGMDGYHDTWAKALGDKFLANGGKDLKLTLMRGLLGGYKPPLDSWKQSLATIEKLKWPEKMPQYIYMGKMRKVLVILSLAQVELLNIQ